MFPGKFDMTFPFDLSVPPLQGRARARCRTRSASCRRGSINRHLLVNRDQPPFDNPELRRAMALRIDRKAFVDTSARGRARSAASCSRRRRAVGHAPGPDAKLPGYGPDVQKNREEARAIMRKLGYGPDNRLKIKVTTRDWSLYRDPAILLIDQLKQVYIDGELELVDTAQYFPKIQRKEYTVALNLQTGGARSRPDRAAVLRLRLEPNWDGYCNPEMDKMIEAQSTRG